MNLPNKITIGRIFLALIIIVILVFPWHQVGYTWPRYLISGAIRIDLKYIVCGALFIIASLTDMLDGSIARSRGLVTDFGKVMDAIADKILVNAILIILAFDGFLPVIIPVIIITRDIMVDSIKMLVGSKSSAVGASLAGKIKSVVMMVGIVFIFFYNLPASLINVAIGNYIVFVATILSVYSGVEYFVASKEYLREM